jgi:DNA processing protein
MGITVISGLALGIDAIAHRGALDGARDLKARNSDSSTSIFSSGYAGCTVAVLGSSVDEVYPASNRELARRILKAGGSLLSEYDPGTTPRKSYYPQRNRIISGLARATVIVEAPEHSGALITGKFALEQGRDLYVASSGVSSSIGKGTRSLAVEGCPVVSSAAEILSDWGIDTSLLQKWDEQNRMNGGSLNSLSLTASLKKEMGL